MLCNEKLVFNNLTVNSKTELFVKLASEYKKLGLINDEELLVSALNEREQLSTTGFEQGIAIPHAQIDIDKPFVSISRINQIDWPSINGGLTDLVINIVVPKDAQSEHLKILAAIAKKLLDQEFVNKLKNASPKIVVELINEIEKTDIKNKQSLNSELNFVAITGCPTGIAHTYMAAENLEKVAKELGYGIKVETQGQAGAENILTTTEINNADGVIIAADVKVDLERFQGKKVIQVPVGRGLKDAEKLFVEVQSAPNLMINQTEQDSDKESEEKFSGYKSLMNGVTHMLPFVVAGGILTALRFLFGTPDDIAAGVEPLIHIETLGVFFGNIGGLLFGMMLPVLAAYIAMSIGKRPALMFGFLAGILANSNGSGFLGAILGGFVAGFVAKGLTSKINKLPKSLRGSATVLFIPLIGAILIGLFMVIFGYPVAWLNTALTNGLQALEDFNPVLLGAVIGIMMASDMGGPINKAAYVTGTLLLAEGNQTFMAAVMAGGMVPPLVIALATTLKPSLYTEDEIDAGKTNYIMGLSFITEGAIPFAAKNPKQFIPPMMIGSAVASALTMLFKITLPAPHGGIFVLPLVNSPLLYLIAIIIGAIVGAIILNIGLKKGRK